MRGEKYKVNLKADMAACDANYVRLKQLLPDFSKGKGRSFKIEHPSKVPLVIQIDFLEHYRYTSTLRISQMPAPLPWMQPFSVMVRLYHDANCAEVLTDHPNSRLSSVYDYPNASGYLPDEKAQHNVFLGQWLQHCLSYGQADFLYSHSSISK